MAAPTPLAHDLSFPPVPSTLAASAWRLEASPMHRTTTSIDPPAISPGSADRRRSPGSPGPLGAPTSPFLVAQHPRHLLQEPRRHLHHGARVETPGPADTGGDSPLPPPGPSPGLPAATSSR